MTRLRRMTYLLMIACGVLVASQAHADDNKFMLYATATTENGSIETIGTIETTTMGECIFNMGVLGGTWYEKDWIGSVEQEYNYDGSTASFSFWSKVRPTVPQVFLIRLTCAALDITA